MACSGVSTAKRLQIDGYTLKKGYRLRLQMQHFYELKCNRLSQRQKPKVTELQSYSYKKF